jgi:tetratricopeptide (TPR) repeat protein
VAAGELYAREATANPPSSAIREQLADQARKAYQQALSIDPKHLPAYRALARLYVDLDDQVHAVATFKKALALFPEDGSLWFDLGMCHARKKEWAPALEALGKAADKEPENRRIVNTLGYALARAGRYPESLACFTRVNSEAQAHFMLAQMLEHLGQPDLSRQQLRLALQKDPQLEAAQALLAKLDGQAAEPIQQTVYTTDAKPIEPDPMPAPQTPPAVEPNSQPEAPADPSGLVPPPPKSSIRPRPAPESAKGK